MKKMFRTDGVEYTSRWDDLQRVLVLVFLVIASFGIFVGITLLFVYIAYGQSGLRIGLVIFGVVGIGMLLFLAVFKLVQLGANMTTRATEVAASVFIRTDYADAVTDRIRLEGHRQLAETNRPVGKPQSGSWDYLEAQLPPPREEITY